MFRSSQANIYYYLFYLDVFNYCPAGNDGAMKVPSNVRSENSLLKLATHWKANRRGSVYLVPSWTQTMCELGPTEFGFYIARNGRKIV